MTTANTKPSGRFARKQAPAVDVPVVRFDDVTKIYDGGSVGLEGASMRIGRGEFVFLVGPTGCGKSTCIRLLMKELEPTKGEIDIAGKTLGQIPRSRVPYLRRNIGTVFQDFKLLPNRTVYDNVAYSLQVIGETRQEIRARCPQSSLSACPPAHSLPESCPAATAARLDRACVRQPPQLLCRRATGNLYPILARDHAADLPINRPGTTVIVATHTRRWSTRCSARGGAARGRIRPLR